MSRAKGAARVAGFFGMLGFFVLLSALAASALQTEPAYAHTKSESTQAHAGANSETPSPSQASTASVPPAGLLITEIMYDVPGANDGRQWIEVANTSAGANAEPIDLAAKTLRLFDTVSAGTASDAHLITAYDGGSTMLAPGGVAVIAENPAKFLADWPSYTGLLLKSAFTLNEAGTVGISDTAGTVLDAVNYTSAEGARGDGNSLQRSSGNTAVSNGFVAGAPTPGIYASPVPAPLVSNAALKQIASKSGTSKRTKRSQASEAVTSHTYEDKGTLAPADSADAASAGAAFITSNANNAENQSLGSLAAGVFLLLAPYAGLLASVWFAAFLALLGFSTFSLLVLQRHYYV